MSNQPENLVLDHLRAIRADTAELKGNVRDVKALLASIESYIATLHGDQARSNISIDEIMIRIERLEARTGIVDA